MRAQEMDEDGIEWEFYEDMVVESMDQRVELGL